MISTRSRNTLVGVAVSLLMLAGCGSSGGDASPDTTDSPADQITTTIADDSSASTTEGSSGSSTTSGSAEDPPEMFGSEVPIPEGATFKKDGFIIGNEGARKSDFTLTGGTPADVLNDYKSTLEAAGFTINSEKPGRSYIATKGDLKVGPSARKDYYEDGVVILSISYNTDES